MVEIAKPGKDIIVTPFQRETGLGKEYAESSWRDEQSIIDIIQNPLDANTSVYEKQLLKAVGVTKYQPDDKNQQQLLLSLNLLKYAKNQKELDKAKQTLSTSALITTPDVDTIKEKIAAVEYKLPDIKLKMTDGKTFEYVDYEAVRDLPETWKVSGFVVDDIGAGFDNRLLGIIGGSLKPESTGKRGGLGEGLKVSVAHLVRSGATVHLVSRNADELWVADPKEENGLINFHGVKLTGEGDQMKGSTTEVDFSSDSFDPNVRQKFIKALDPRKGEGLGKYILDFRGDGFIPLIHSGSIELETHDVPGSRVYVMGLLVQEQMDTMWHYNIADKWAITGRDRKQVKKAEIDKVIKETISSLDDKEKINQIIQETKKTHAAHEITLLNSSLPIPPENQAQWREVIEEAFEFTPGKTVFTTSSTDSKARLFATERGYKVVPLPDTNARVIPFFQLLYPNQMISVEELIISDSLPSNQHASPVLDIGHKGEPVEPATDTFLQKCRDDFARWMLPYVSKKDRDRAKNVQFAKAPRGELMERQANMGYQSTQNVIRVEGSLTHGFRDRAEVAVQLLKALREKTVFDPITQDYLTNLAGESVGSLRPDLEASFVSPLNLVGAPPDATANAHYTLRQRARDEARWEYGQAQAQLEQHEITEDQVQEALRIIALKEPMFVSTHTIQPLRENATPSIYYFDGQFYSMFPHLKTLVPLSLTDTTTIPGETGDKIFQTPAAFERKKSILRQQSWSTTPAQKKLSIGPNKYGEDRVDKIISYGETQENFEIVPYEQNLSSAKPFVPDTTPFIHLSRMLLEPDQPEYHIQAGKNAYLPFQLQEGGSLQLTFSAGSDRGTITIKRRGNKIRAVKIVGDTSTPIALTEYNTLFATGGGGVRLSPHVIEFGTTKNMTINIHRGTPIRPEELQETNKGQAFLKANITIDYGGPVWQEDPRRIFLDAEQNHIDAQNNTLPRVIYTVVGARRNIEQVSAEELQNRDENWKIIGIDIEDDGQGYATPYLTSFKSSKTDDDIGKFGEGLKLLCAAAVKQGISVKLSSRDWAATPTTYPEIVNDYETETQTEFTKLAFAMSWSETPKHGSQSQFSFFSSPLHETTLTTEQQAEFADQESDKSKTWQAWVDVLDPRKTDAFGNRGLARYVLPKQDRPFTNGVVTLLTDYPANVYEKNLLIPQDNPKKSIFGYNIDETIINTRERNSYNEKLRDAYVRDYFRNLTDTAVMKHVFEAAKANPHENYYEYKFLEQASEATKVLWKQAYYEVFGENAILSLQSLENKDREDFRSSQWAGPVDVERHLEERNLQRLPYELTHLLYDHQVYSSKNFLTSLQQADVVVTPQEKNDVVTFVRNANQLILTMLESLASNPETSAYLDSIVLPDVLEERKRKLQTIDPDNIHIKHASYAANGRVRQGNDIMEVDLNQKIFESYAKALGIYVHEAAHFLSGAGDYTIEFQRFLMALVLARPPQRA